MIGTPSRFNPFSFVFSTQFSSLGQLCRFYYADSFFPFVTNHWDTIHWFLTVWSPSRFDGSLFFLPLVSHLCDDFVASFCGHSFFNLVCHYWDAPRRPYLSLIVCSFNFSSFRRHPRFCLCLFFIPFVSYYWNGI